jgi:uncharacterized protein YecT (DUF1311 family)
VDDCDFGDTDENIVHSQQPRGFQPMQPISQIQQGAKPKKQDPKEEEHQPTDKDFNKAYKKLINQMMAVDLGAAAVFVPN